MDISIVQIMIQIIRSLASDILLIHSFNLMFVCQHRRDVARYVSNCHTPIISFHLYETLHATSLQRQAIIRNMDISIVYISPKIQKHSLTITHILYQNCKDGISVSNHDTLHAAYLRNEVVFLVSKTVI